MQTVTLNTAIKDLPKLIASTIANNEETNIVTDEGEVVMIDRKNWESWNETLRLLNDTRSFKALMEVQQALKKGEKPTGKTVEEIINGL